MTREDVTKLYDALCAVGQSAAAVAFLTHDQAQRARIQELEQWQKIVTGTRTDQEAVIRMAATEYTKFAIQAWKEKCEQQAKEIVELRAVIGDKVQYLCVPCNTVHPVCGTRIFQECPTCRAAMLPTSLNLRRIEQQAKEIERLRAVNSEWRREFRDAVDSYSSLEKENAALQEALQLLYDCQNGCPLPKYEAEWNRAMALTRSIIEESI